MCYMYIYIYIHIVHIICIYIYTHHVIRHLYIWRPPWRPRAATRPAWAHYVILCYIILCYIILYDIIVHRISILYYCYYH